MDIDLGSVQTVSSLSIDKRPGYSDANYGLNGTMGKFKLYVSEDGTNYTFAGAGEFTAEAYNLHEENGLYNVGRPCIRKLQEEPTPPGTCVWFRNPAPWAAAMSSPAQS